MEQIEKNQTTMKEEMDAMKGTVDQILESMMTLARREDNPQVPVGTENTTPLFGSTSHKRHEVADLEFILPHGYTPLETSNWTYINLYALGTITNNFIDAKPIRVVNNYLSMSRIKICPICLVMSVYIRPPLL